MDSDEVLAWLAIDVQAGDVACLDDVELVDALDVGGRIDRQTWDQAHLGRDRVGRLRAQAQCPSCAGGMDDRGPRSQASRLRRAVHHVDAPAEIDDAHQQDQEWDDGEGELDERLAATAGVVVSRPVVGAPAHRDPHQFGGRQTSSITVVANDLHCVASGFWPWTLPFGPEWTVMTVVG